MEKEEFLKLLSKKVSDGLDREEQIAFDIYLNSHSAYVPVVEQLEDFFANEDLSVQEKEQKLHLKKLIRLIGNAEREKKSRFGMRSFGYLVAACLLLFFLWNIFVDKSMLKEGNVQLAFQEVQSSEKNYWLTLDDGTSVVLSRGSTLRYNSEFGSVQRLASLNGSARFDVVKNAEKPMHIDLGEWEAVVKGTLFDIKQNESTGQKELTLYHGKVELINKKDITQILSILPYHKVTWRVGVNRTSDIRMGILSPKDRIAAQHLYQDSLVFSKITFKELAVILKQQYKKEFVFENTKVAKRQFSGKMSNLKLQELLHVLSVTNPFDFEIKDSVVIIK